VTDTEAREEIKAAIEHYEARGACWLSAVTFLGIRQIFGSWYELVDGVRRPWAQGRKRR